MLLPLLLLPPAAAVTVHLPRQNKLQTPLKEIFSTCLTPEQLRQLLHGPHTQFRASGTATGEALESLSAAPPSSLSLSTTSPAKPPPPAAAAAAGGPKTPTSAGKGRRGKGAAGPVGSPNGSGGQKKGGSSAAARQQGSMKQFFTTTARCLGCKSVLQSSSKGTAAAAAGSRTAHQQQQQQKEQPPAGVEPGLCPTCREEEGKLQAVYLHTVADQGSAAASLVGAHSACRRCHSGGQMGAVVCENGECPVLYVRYQSERQLRNADHRLLRLEW